MSQCRAELYDDRLSELSRSDLLEAVDCLVINNKKMNEDIHLARTIQAKMLPTLKEYGPFSFDYSYMPSEELSGDFFDLVEIDKGCLAFYISDVVGHGVSASILTMFIRQTMRSILQEQKLYKPNSVLEALREHFLEIHMDADQYFSIFYALIDVDRALISYSNAGHNCWPIIERQGKTDFLRATGSLISPVFSQKKYREYRHKLENGDRFLFYTDGAVEIRDDSGVEYGTDRLEKIMSEGKSNCLETIVKDYRSYHPDRIKDDIALFYMEYKI